MKKTFEKLLRLDRRIFFVILSLALAVPIIKPLNLPGAEPAKDVKSIYNKIESLPEGSALMLSFDFDPASRPELYPQCVAVARHAFKKNLRVVALYFWPAASGIVEEVFAKVAPEYGKIYGKDYVIFPYQPKIDAVLTQMGSDIYGVYNKDKNGADLKTLPVMQGIKNYKDVAFVMDFAAGATIEYWVAYASDKFGFKLGGGCTAISQPGYGPYLQTGQLTGLLGGMKGAADYENLIKQAGKGTSGMDALNVAHFLVLALIIISNLMIAYIKFF